MITIKKIVSPTFVTILGKEEQIQHKLQWVKPGPTGFTKDHDEIELL
jgi:hypothetical protein